MLRCLYREQERSRVVVWWRIQGIVWVVQFTQQLNTAQVLLIVLALYTENSPSIQHNQYPKQQQIDTNCPNIPFSSSRSTNNSLFVNLSELLNYSQDCGYFEFIFSTSFCRVFYIYLLCNKLGSYSFSYLSQRQAEWSRFVSASFWLSQKRSGIGTQSGLKLIISYIYYQRPLNTSVQLWQNPYAQMLTSLCQVLTMPPDSQPITSTKFLLTFPTFSFPFFPINPEINPNPQKNSPKFFFPK